MTGTMSSRCAARRRVWRLLITVVACAALCAVVDSSSSRHWRSLTEELLDPRAKGLDEGSPCCRLCPSLFYHLKPTPWMEGAKQEWTDSIKMQQAQKKADDAKMELAALETPKTQSVTSFLEQAMALNTHKQIESVCCNVCKEEYTNNLQYPDLLTYEGAAPPSESSDEILIPADAEYIETEADIGDESHQSSQQKGFFDTVSKIADTAGKVVKSISKGDFSGALGHITAAFKKNAPVSQKVENMSGNDFVKAAEAARTIAANKQRQDANKIMVDNAPQQIANLKLPPCCNFCPYGCAPLYVPDNAAPQLIKEEDRRPSDAAVGAYKPSPLVSEILQKEKDAKDGKIVDKRSCCTRKEAIDYVVDVSDTMASIESEFCTTFEQVRQVNPELVEPSLLKAGTHLRIPLPNCRPTQAASNAQQAQTQAQAAQSQAQATVKASVGGQKAAAQNTKSTPKSTATSLSKATSKKGFLFLETEELWDASHTDLADPNATMDANDLPDSAMTPEQRTRFSQARAFGFGDIGGLVNKAKDVAAKVQTTAKEVATKVTNTVKEVATKVSNTVTQVANTVKSVADKVSATAQKVVSAVNNTINTVANAVQHVVNTVKSIATNITNAVSSVKSFLSFNLPSADSPMGKVTKQIQTAVAAAQQFFEPVPVKPVDLPPPEEKEFEDKQNRPTIFDPPGTGVREDRCQPKILQNCCHICYTTWPGQHPSAEAKKRRADAIAQEQRQKRRAAYQEGSDPSEV